MVGWRRGAAVALAAVAALTASPVVAAGMDAFVPAGRAIVAPPGAVALCDLYAWACARSGAPVTPDQIEVARVVSRQVNAGIRAITDPEQYGTAEHWSLPTVRGGDCEDLALLKKRVLISRGLPADRLLMAVVLDRDRNAHAVLVLRTGEGDLILDNLTDEVFDWRGTGYAFVRMQDPEDPARWVSVLAGGHFAA